MNETVCHSIFMRSFWRMIHVVIRIWIDNVRCNNYSMINGYGWKSNGGFFLNRFVSHFFVGFSARSAADADSNKNSSIPRAAKAFQPLFAPRFFLSLVRYVFPARRSCLASPRSRFKLPMSYILRIQEHVPYGSNKIPNKICTHIFLCVPDNVKNGTVGNENVWKYERMMWNKWQIFAKWPEGHEKGVETGKARETIWISVKILHFHRSFMWRFMSHVRILFRVSKLKWNDRGTTNILQYKNSSVAELFSLFCVVCGSIYYLD